MLSAYLLCQSTYLCLLCSDFPCQQLINSVQYFELGTSLTALAEKKGAEHSHKNEAGHGKKYEKGSSGHHMKEKKDHKKGEFDEAKHHGGKHGGMKGGYQSQSKHEGGFEKADHKLKKGSYGKKGVKKKHSKKKVPFQTLSNIYTKYCLRISKSRVRSWEK